MWALSAGSAPVCSCTAVRQAWAEPEIDQLLVLIVLIRITPVLSTDFHHNGTAGTVNCIDQ